MEDRRCYVPGDEASGSWVITDELWLRLDVTPEIKVTLVDGTTANGAVDAVFRALNANMAQPALHYTLITDETPTELWYGGQHEACLVIGTVPYRFPLTEEGPWHIDAHPDSVTITLTEDYSFSNGDMTMSFTNEEGDCLALADAALEEALGMPFSLRWNSDETPGARWQPGTDGDAWVEIHELCSDGIFPYTVHVTE